MQATGRSFVRASGADAERLLPLMREFYASEDIPYDEATSRRAVSALLEHAARGSIWLIYHGSEVIGYVALTHGFILEFGGRHMVLDELYIRPEHQGKGHGRAALQKAEEVCASEGIGTLRLEVEHANTRAEALYLRNGFVSHERRTFTKILK